PVASRQALYPNSTSTWACCAGPWIKTTNASIAFWQNNKNEGTRSHEQVDLGDRRGKVRHREAPFRGTARRRLSRTHGSRTGPTMDAGPRVLDDAGLHQRGETRRSDPLRVVRRPRQRLLPDGRDHRTRPSPSPRSRRAHAFA